MKVTTLKNKLVKMNISYTESKGDITFVLNKKPFIADTNNSENVFCFFHVTGYNAASQETDRRFFDNFNQVFRYSQR
jgi:hypothetical protein